MTFGCRFTPGDYLRDTQHLTTEEHGAYLLLLICFWSANGSIAYSDERFASITKTSIDRWQSRIKPALEPFFQIADGKWSHKRVVRERFKADRIRQLRSEAGKLGGRVKANPNQIESKPESKTEANQKYPQSQSHKDIDKESVVHPIELPSGFPKTVEEAEVAAAAVGCPPQFARTTWNKAHGRLGRDSCDVAIRVWPSYLASQWAYEQNRVAELRQTSSTAQSSSGTLDATEKILRSKELERVEARMAAIRQQYSGLQSWSIEDRAEIKKLRERREVLKRMLGLIV